MVSAVEAGGLDKVSADCQQKGGGGGGLKFQKNASADMWMPPKRREMRKT